MIFVTVGTQGPFDRLVRTVDQWAASKKRTDVFAQIGPSKSKFEHIHAEKFIDPAEFRKRAESANLIIAHAGMGSIITALELGKRIIVMPRQASKGEQRNDHQLATAKRLAEQGSIDVAFDETELMDKLINLNSIDTAKRLSTQASPDLISAIRTFIESGRLNIERVPPRAL
jgi:UDP-N-acetylglucosamine transferase subunit ALG13